MNICEVRLHGLATKDNLDRVFKVADTCFSFLEKMIIVSVEFQREATK